MLILASLAIGLSGIMVSIIGAGDADISKHEFLFTLAFDLVSLLAVSGVVGRRVSSSHEPAVGRAGKIPNVQEGVSA
ncbi:hypothetical protein D3C79_897710 [compost metagenome]